MPEMGDLQEITQIDDRFSEDVPSLVLPPFLYSGTFPEPQFSAAAPAIDPMPEEPAVPPLEPPEWPTLTVPELVAAPSPVAISAPVPPNPDNIPEFDEDLFETYQDVLGSLGADTADWVRYLNSMRANLLPVERLLTDHIRTTLIGGSATFYPDGWELRKFQQDQHQALVERHNALEALDSLPSSQTGLPGGARVSAYLRAELKALTAVAKAAGRAADDRQEREAKHVQWAMELALRMADAALSIRAQEIAYKMKTVEFALEGADATLDLVLKVVEFKRKCIELYIRRVKLCVRYIEDQMKIEQTKIESVKIAAANNKLLSTHNAHQVEVFGAAVEFMRTRVKLYEQRIEYLTLDVAHRKLAMLLFEGQVAAYDARTQANRATIAARRATIKGDMAKADGELAKVRLYEARLVGKIAELDALVATMKAQTAQAKGLIDAYLTTVDANLKYLNLIDDSVRVAMTALTKGFDAEVAEQELKLMDQALKDQVVIDTELDVLGREQVDLTTRLSKHRVSLAQLDAQAKIINNGASTLGGIASAAFQDLNGIAVTELAGEV
jgi:hypothetical protein